MHTCLYQPTCPLASPSAFLTLLSLSPSPLLPLPLSPSLLPSHLPAPQPLLHFCPPSSIPAYCLVVHLPSLLSSFASLFLTLCLPILLKTIRGSRFTSQYFHTRLISLPSTFGSCSSVPLSSQHLTLDFYRDSSSVNFYRTSTTQKTNHDTGIHSRRPCFLRPQSLRPPITIHLL